MHTYLYVYIKNKKEERERERERERDGALLSRFDFYCIRLVFVCPGCPDGISGFSGEIVFLRQD